MICDKLRTCMNEQFAGRKISTCINNNCEICVESSDRRSKVKCEERNKKYVLENTERNHIISYKMDGGIVVDDKTLQKDTRKCDYMYLIDGKKQYAILVELKGVDVAHALRQIHGTLILYQDFFGGLSQVYGRVVVASSTPNLKASPGYVNLSRFIRRAYNGNIKIKEKIFVEKDTELNAK